ncbi:MAG: contractile injection system tape measure protein [Cyclobacteriaceae bacterium]
MHKGAHIIKKQILEFQVKDQQQALETQDALLHLFNTKVNEVLEEICNRYDIEDAVIRIDQIELDLGTIGSDQITDGLSEKIGRLLADEISKHVHYLSGRSSHFNTGGELINREVTMLENFRYYLKNGSLPWNCNTSISDLTAQFRRSMTSDPARLTKILLGDLCNTDIRKRVVYLFDKQELNLLSVALYPAYQNQITQFIGEVTSVLHEENLNATQVTKFEKLLFEILIDHAISSSGHFSSDRLITRFFSEIGRVVIPISPEEFCLSFVSNVRKLQKERGKQAIRHLQVVLDEDRIHTLRNTDSFSLSETTTKNDDIIERRHSDGMEDTNLLADQQRDDIKYKSDKNINQNSAEHDQNTESSRRKKKQEIRGESVVKHSGSEKGNNKFDAQHPIKNKLAKFDTESVIDNSSSAGEPKEQSQNDQLKNFIPEKEKIAGSGVIENPYEKVQGDQPDQISKRNKANDQNNERIDQSERQNSSQALARNNDNSDTSFNSNAPNRKNKKSIDSSNSSDTDLDKDGKGISSGKQPNRRETGSQRKYKTTDVPRGQNSVENAEKPKPREVTDDAKGSSVDKVTKTAGRQPPKETQNQLHGNSDTERNDLCEEEKSDVVKRQENVIMPDHWEKPIRDLSEAYIDNVGLVLFTPFLPTLFKEMQWIDQGRFISDIHQFRAATFLQYLVVGEKTSSENDLLLNKLLVGLRPEMPLPTDMLLTEEEKEEAIHLLQVVIDNWKVLKGTSPEGLRTTFLQREGHLRKDFGGWKMQVHRITMDVLLDRLPWSYSIIKLPWLTEMIYVEW